VPVNSPQLYFFAAIAFITTAGSAPVSILLGDNAKNVKLAVHAIALAVVAFEGRVVGENGDVSEKHELLMSSGSSIRNRGMIGTF